MISLSKLSKKKNPSWTELGQSEDVDYQDVMIEKSCSVPEVQEVL